MQKALTASGVVLAIVFLCMFTGLTRDLFDGLPFTRSDVSWGYWATGLFVGGLGLLAWEAFGEWLVGGDQPGERPRRTTLLMRLTIVAVFVALAIAAVAIWSR
jgi:hypothetical protein